MIEEEKLYSGFPLKEQELKYNLTLFDLIMTLAARVTASLKLSNKLSKFSIL
jgi:hypothetical protein